MCDSRPPAAPLFTPGEAVVLAALLIVFGVLAGVQRLTHGIL